MTTGGPVHVAPGQRLRRSFFARQSPDVARDLIGCWLVRALDGRTTRVQVTETEAYLGEGDPGSHAFRGRTARNAPMFGRAGIAYVYFVYGMHHCFNVVTGAAGDPQAVLIRAALAEPLAAARLGGPALVCRGLGIDLGCNGLDLCRPTSPLWFERGSAPPAVAVTARIGVRDTSQLRYLLQVSSADPIHRTKKRAPQGARS